MKTLSEDITLTLPTTNMQQGYVNTLIYHNDAEIFAGRTYIPGNNSSIYVNINDFVIQNHGKNDRLKLNDDGELVSTPLDSGSEVPKIWEDGQVGNYKVSISQDTSQYGNVSYSASTNAVCGYDYINEDLKPTIIDNDGKSELGRLLQGTNWYVNYQDSRGVFNNKLLPHVPNKPTKKFGIGLQIYTNYYSHPERKYALRTSYGKEYDLGPADYLNGSNQTFVTLSDLYQAEISALGEDTSLFLKYQGSSNDEFGHFEEGINKYIGECPIAIMDGCWSNKRYYLAWMDRYGDYMSQPFEGKYEYSEDFEKSEMKDYKLKRRIIHNELQPKWKLNSTWINEEFYPYYEAIFTSPYLLLYDTKTDRAWNVILSDNSYLEKTFKNQKKLFNLEINVEANTKQNYIF